MIELLPNRVGSRTFIGNSALVPAGINVGDDGLIGVLSTPPAEGKETQHNTRWLGSPGFLLPTTEKATCFSAQQTFEPGFFPTCARAFVDLVRVLLPGMVSMAALVAFCVAVYQSYYNLSFVATLLLTPIFALASAFVNLLTVIVLRRAFMPRFKPVVKPLWCSYVWFNEVVNAIYEAAAAPVLFPMLGTPYVAWFLRRLGCRVGKWAFLETTLMSEFDLVTIGDRAALNIGSTIQPHLFEDRVMKSDTINIGECCSVGNMAVVLYGTRMENGATLESLSVLMKGESLPRWSRWHGIPSQPCESESVGPDRQRLKAAGIASPPRRSAASTRSLQKWLRTLPRPARARTAESKSDPTAADANDKMHGAAA